MTVQRMKTPPMKPIRYERSPPPISLGGLRYYYEPVTPRKKKQPYPTTLVFEDFDTPTPASRNINKTIKSVY